jgi:hypothetical protein
MIGLLINSILLRFMNLILLLQCTDIKDRNILNSLILSLYILNYGDYGNINIRTNYNATLTISITVVNQL